jgi:hypothetical protein
MDFIGGLSSVVSIVSFVIFAAGVMKVFQVANTLLEIKDLLTAIKLNAPIHPPTGAALQASAPLPLPQSGEEMLRALSMELDHPVNPTSIELGNKS